jgi:cytochrome c biogenesis protein CcdA
MIHDVSIPAALIAGIISFLSPACCRWCRHI